jgi:putative ABC transport system substrate-binding protein
VPFAASTVDSSVGKQAAVLADKILKGVPAGTIPVVSAEFWLQINFQLAQQLGLKVSDDLLSQANEIIRSHQGRTRERYSG